MFLLPSLDITLGTLKKTVKLQNSRIFRSQVSTLILRNKKEESPQVLPWSQASQVSATRSLLIVYLILTNLSTPSTKVGKFSAEVAS